MDEARDLKTLLLQYCWNHPEVVHFLTKKSKKEEENKERIKKINEVLKNEKLAFKDLVSGLSLPFRHTERYPLALVEILRNTPDAHPDLGDLQRACTVYRHMTEECAALRKQKEVQWDFINTGVLDKTLGKNYLDKFGAVMHISSVTVTQAASRDSDTVFERQVHQLWLTVFRVQVPSALPESADLHGAVGGEERLHSQGRDPHGRAEGVQGPDQHEADPGER